MNRQSCKKQLNCKKDQLFKGKITKSYKTFSENKPNSPIVQMNVTDLIKMIYVIFASLTKVKNKPNSNPIQTQNEPNPRKAKNERKYLLYKGI